jgi:predicted methyltransferase
MTGYILSQRFVQPILAARGLGAEQVETSLDLGLTQSSVSIRVAGVGLPDDTLLSWKAVEEVAAGGSACYVVEGDSVRKAATFSEDFGRAYSLMTTDGAPTLLNSGFTMHRIVGIDPWEDARRKIATVAPLRGRVLDANTGLGYTAIRAALTADEVVTVELDSAVLEMARLNPWSRELFESPKITQVVGDASDEVARFETGSFSRIIHDPPSFSLAGDLYSGAYYRELFRVLARKGRLFHYIGDLESAHARRVVKGVVQRLKAAGFTRVTPAQQAFGLVALK